MATRNFVPRADGEGSIGTEAKNWGNGFFKKAAIGALTKTVSVLVPADDANDQQPATTSWVRARFRSILETVLSAAGLKYNIESNGYICFGALFGNLILQWGITETYGVNASPITYPIGFSNAVAYANAMVIDAPIGWPVGTSTITYDDLSIGVSVKSLNTLNVYSALNTEKFNLKWVAIGY